MAVDCTAYYTSNDQKCILKFTQKISAFKFQANYRFSLQTVNITWLEKFDMESKAKPYNIYSENSIYRVAQANFPVRILALGIKPFIILKWIFYGIYPEGYLIQRYNHFCYNLFNEKVMIFLQKQVENPCAH